MARCSEKITTVEGRLAADFGTDSAVELDADGLYRGKIDDAWSGPPGPNGGYIAALLLGAIRSRIDDRSRAPRSITIHYLRPPLAGEVEIAVEIERSGRTASTATARMSQAGKQTCLAICVLVGEIESAAEWSEPAPEVPPPDQVDRVDAAELTPRIFEQLDFRPLFGSPPFSGGERALAGGWLRTRSPSPLGPELLALYADAWWPAPFARVEAPLLAPTLELTIHFRAAAPAGGGEHPFVLTRFVSATSAEGFFEEDGQIWSEDGTLLAQSRQLALCRPWRP